MKKHFTAERWEKALAAVFVRSISDPQYRQLCVTDARAAVEAVAPDLELPRHFHLKFVAHSRDFIHCYLLPPMLEDGVSTLEYAKRLIEQDVSGKTHPPTNNDGLGGSDPDDPNNTQDSNGDGNGEIDDEAGGQSGAALP